MCIRDSGRSWYPHGGGHLYQHLLLQGEPLPTGRGTVELLEVSGCLLPQQVICRVRVHQFHRHLRPEPAHARYLLLLCRSEHGRRKGRGYRPHAWLALRWSSPGPAAVPQPSRCLGRETLCARVCLLVRHWMHHRVPVPSPAHSDDGRLSVDRRWLCWWHVPHSTDEW